MTVQQCVDSALRKIGVIAPGETPSPEERDAGMSALNTMISAWNDALLKALAGSYAAPLYTFNPLSNYTALTDNLGVSLGWERAYIYNLAVELAPEFGAAVSEPVAAVAGTSKTAVVTLANPVI